MITPLDATSKTSMLKIIVDRSSVTNIPDQATINNNYELYGDKDSEDLGAENDGDDHDSGISFSDNNDK